MRNLDTGAVQAKYLVRTHSVFKVLAFHPENQTVDIKQEMFELVHSADGEIYKQNEFGVDVPYALRTPDILYGIPVKQMRYGQFAIKVCPVEGDTGYVEYFHDDITGWFEEGGVAVPRNSAKFLRASCVFVPGVFDENNATQDYPTDNTKLIIAGKDATIEIVNPAGDDPATQINIVAKTVNVTAEKSKFNGDMEVSGDIKASGDVKAGNISLLNHKHNVPAGATVQVSTTTGTGSVQSSTTTGAAQ
ncbi:MAG: hypothetical protein IKA01_09925 [Alistipes sp.]|nr:hypothetical protein [Alistipes sp.]